MDEMEQARRIASSDAGRQLQRLANTPEIESAAKSGDMDALRDAVAKLLKSDAGAKLAGQISELIK